MYLKHLLPFTSVDKTGICTCIIIAKEHYCITLGSYMYLIRTNFIQSYHFQQHFALLSLILHYGEQVFVCAGRNNQIQVIRISGHLTY